MPVKKKPRRKPKPSHDLQSQEMIEKLSKYKEKLLDENKELKTRIRQLEQQALRHG